MADLTDVITDGLEKNMGSIFDAIFKRLDHLGFIVVKKSDVLRARDICNSLRDDGYSNDAMIDLDIAMTRLTLPFGGPKGIK